MALVKLKYDWFAPGGIHYRRGETGVVEVPDNLLAALPETAKVLNERPAQEVVADDSLKDFDPVRAAADAEGVVLDAAERERLNNQRRIQEALAREKAKK